MTVPVLSLLVALTAPVREARTQATAAALVAQLYRTFAWEAVVEEPSWPGHALLEQPRGGLLRYFDKTLTDLLLADRACAARIQGICRLDWDPIWDSQDPGGANELKITTTQDPGVVSVKFQYPNGETRELTYRLSRTPSGWRIHDIVSRTHGSLLAILSAPASH